MEEVSTHMTKRFNGLVAMGAAGLLAVAGAVPATAQETTSIDMIGAGYEPEMEPYYSDLAARFMEANPDIDVAVQVVSWTDIYDVLNTRVAAGDPPDIMNLNYFANFAADGLLRPAEDIVTPEVLDGIIQAFRDNSKYDGIEYAVPDLASARLFFYNTDVLDAAGIEPPTTWSEMLTACEAILAKVPGVIPYGIPLGPEEAQAEFLMWAGGNGGGVFDGENWIVNSAENLETLEFLQTLVDNGCTQPSIGTSNRSAAGAGAAVLPLFAQGVVAMANGSVFFPGQLESGDLGGSPNYGTTAIPAADGKEGVTLGVQDYFYAFNNEGNQEAVQKFLSFLYEPDNYAGFLGAAGGFLPATKAAGEAMSDDPGLAPFIEVLPSAIFYPSDQAEWAAVQGAIQQGLGAAFAGEDKQQVLDQIQAVATGE